jgi:hypothetical protein
VFDTQAAGGMIGYVGERACSVSTFFDYEWSALNNNLGPPPPVAVPPSGPRADAMKRQSDSFLDSNKSGWTYPFVSAQGFMPPLTISHFFCRFKSESCRVDVKLLRAKSAASCACMLISNFIIKYAAAADCTVVEHLLAYNDDDYGLRRATKRT